MAQFVRTRNACHFRRISAGNTKVTADPAPAPRQDTAFDIKKKIVSAILAVLQNAEEGIKQQTLFSRVSENLKEQGITDMRTLRKTISDFIRVQVVEWVESSIRLKDYWIEEIKKNFEHACSKVLYEIPAPSPLA